MSLIQTDDPMGDAPAIRVMENALLPNEFTHHQQFLIPVPASSQKACPTGDQGIDAGQIPLQMAELLFDRLAGLADARPLLLLLCRSLRLGPRQGTAAVLSCGVSGAFGHRAFKPMKNWR